MSLSTDILNVVMKDLSGRKGIFDGIEEDMIREIKEDLFVHILAVVKNATR